VLDTNVLLDWLIFADPGIRPLAALIEAAQVRLANRADCRDEFIRVLTYPILKADAARQALALAVYDRHHGLNHGLIEAALVPLVALPQCSDADDQKFLEVARDARAAWLITKDKALLKLKPAVNRLGYFEILDVGEAVQRLPGPFLPLQE
jgi:predicted nucleic acid-binding protein